MSSLAGQRVFLTGAGGGIGRGLALAFAEAGARVGLTDIDAEALAGAVDALPGADEAPWSEPLDVTDAAAVSLAVTGFAAASGGLDILVNAAGVLSVAKVVDLEPAEWRRVLDVNATGTFLVAQAAARVMIAAGSAGSIVNIASISGKVGDPTLAHYCASKFAVVGFTQALARELAVHGITVNALCPGIVETAMIDELAAGWGYSVEDFMASQLVKRPQTPEEFAAAVAFLHASRSITGQSLNIDGGTYFH